MAQTIIVQDGIISYLKSDQTTNVDFTINGQLNVATEINVGNNPLTPGTITSAASQNLQIFPGAGGNLKLSASAGGAVTINNSAWPAATGGIGTVLTTIDGLGNLGWSSSGSGTVTSVGLTMPSDFSVSIPTITTTGTFNVTRTSQTANTFLAAPNGSAGTPTYRAMLAADLPQLPYDITLSSTGAAPIANTVIVGMVVTRVINLAVGLPGSLGVTTTAGSTTTILNIRQNGTVIGTITFAAAATSGVISFTSPITLSPADIFDMAASATVAADIGNIFVTVSGTSSA